MKSVHETSREWLRILKYNCLRRDDQVLQVHTLRQAGAQLAPGARALVRLRVQSRSCCRFVL